MNISHILSKLNAKSADKKKRNATITVEDEEFGSSSLTVPPIRGHYEFLWLRDFVGFRL